MRDKWFTDENPPFEKEDYMITDEYGDIQIASWTNSSIFGGTTDWHWVGLVQFTHVKAWRPLPEPPKDGEYND